MSILPIFVPFSMSWLPFLSSNSSVLETETNQFQGTTIISKLITIACTVIFHFNICTSNRTIGLRLSLKGAILARPLSTGSSGGRKLASSKPPPPLGTGLDSRKSNLSHAASRCARSNLVIFLAPLSRPVASTSTSTDNGGK